MKNALGGKRERRLKRGKMIGEKMTWFEAYRAAQEPRQDVRVDVVEIMLNAR